MPSAITPGEQPPTTLEHQDNDSEQLCATMFTKSGRAAHSMHRRNGWVRVVGGQKAFERVSKGKSTKAKKYQPNERVPKRLSGLNRMNVCDHPFKPTRFNRDCQPIREYKLNGIARWHRVHLEHLGIVVAESQWLDRSRWIAFTKSHWLNHSHRIVVTGPQSPEWIAVPSEN